MPYPLPGRKRCPSGNDPQPVKLVFVSLTRYLGVVATSISVQQRNLLWIFLVTLLAFDCSAPIATPKSPVGDGSAKTVFFVNYGWHSAIVLRKADLPAAALPEIMDFPQAEYLEFGWGDRDYYPAMDPGFGLAIKAAFLSSGSVVHVTGIRGAVENFFGTAEIVDINLSIEAFQRLVKFVSDSFYRSPDTGGAEARPGLYSNSRFYVATGQFHLFNTCNTWVAAAFHTAGLPVNPAFAFTAGNLSQQVKPLGARRK